MMTEFTLHKSQSDIAKTSPNPGVNAKGDETLNKKEPTPESQSSDDGLLSSVTPLRDSCCTLNLRRSEGSSSNILNTEDESDVESGSCDSTTCLASLSLANDQPSSQQPSKSTSDLVIPSGTSDAASNMNSEIEETGQLLTSLEIKGMVESDEKSEDKDEEEDDDEEEEEEQTDINDAEESYTIESFEDDE
ncbi:conserved hypothetical protein [Echinococcus multilocularis]|uniref:Uncharacterized protein n=1 Tax=Echinococcus multilocularis TaxID=6211 RepID=A0A068Y5V5_ECHMU|nr:conserved hypothetical protein [Echinococcus multilocularis]